VPGPTPPRLPNCLQPGRSTASAIGHDVNEQYRHGCWVIGRGPADGPCQAEGVRDHSPLAHPDIPRCQEVEADGRVHVGTPRSHHPYGVPTWHITARPHVTERVGPLLGGEPGQPSDAGVVELATEVTDLAISVPGPDAVRLQWRAGSSLGFCEAAGGSGRWVCPSSLQGRRQAARLGKGCEPHAQVLFRLTHAPQLGLFVFTSGNWSFAEDLIAAASVLCDGDGMAQPSSASNGSPADSPPANRSSSASQHLLSASRRINLLRGILGLFTLLSGKDDPHALVKRNLAPSR
jgi:hypothetical protein